MKTLIFLLISFMFVASCIKPVTLHHKVRPDEYKLGSEEDTVIMYFPLSQSLKNMNTILYWSCDSIVKINRDATETDSLYIYSD